MSTFSRILFLTFLIIASVLNVHSQGTLSARNVQPTSSTGENDNDRARDGLLGPVRRIRTEVVKVTSADGKVVENGKRVLLETVEYDLKGTKTVNQYFPVAGASPTGREVYQYDDKGNISEMTLTGQDGALISKEVYKYEYDSLGNWTKMTTSVAVVENGAISFEPTEVTYRMISYYLNATMANVLEPANNTVAPAPKSSNNTAANKTNANVKSSKQQPAVVSVPMPRRSTIALAAYQPQVDIRNASFVPNQVTVDNAPLPPAVVSRTPVSGGVLNGNALSLPTPLYPDTARRMNIAGVVEVEVLIDENGKVVSARAVSGPSALRDNAVQAALRARFTPTKLSGQPVKVSGKIVYNFKRV